MGPHPHKYPGTLPEERATLKRKEWISNSELFRLISQMLFCPKALSRKYSLCVSENSESVLEEVKLNVGLSG